MVINVPLNSSVAANLIFAARFILNINYCLFSVSFPYRFRIVSVSFPYRFRIVSVSFPYRFRIILLSSSYCEAENNTETIRNRTNGKRMRKGGTREVHLTFIVNSYDNDKTQTNYLGVKMSLSTTTKSDKPMHKKSRILNTLPNEKNR